MEPPGLAGGQGRRSSPNTTDLEPTKNTNTALAVGDTEPANAMAPLPVLEEPPGPVCGGGRRASPYTADLLPANGANAAAAGALGELMVGAIHFALVSANNDPKPQGKSTSANSSVACLAKNESPTTPIVTT